MMDVFIAQAPTTVGSGWSQTIQKALQSILSTANLSGWVDKTLVMSQFIGVIIFIIAMGRKFMKCKEDQSGMAQVFVTFVACLVMMGIPRMVVGVVNRATQAVTPSEWKVNWQTDGTFQRPKIMTDMIDKVSESINPKGYDAGANQDKGKHSAWVGWVPGLTKLLDGVDSLDPVYWIGFALSSIVQFFADTALFVLGILYLVMALIMEVNLLLFPVMIALLQVEWLGFNGVAREYFKHGLAVFLWPLGWGVGVLSAEGVFSGITNFPPTIAGLIGFTLSLFLVCFWLCFASVAGPAFFHKTITSGASLGQPLMAGGLGAGGAMALNGAGSLASGLLGGLGKAIAGLGGGLAKLIRPSSGSGGSGGSGGDRRSKGAGEEGGGGGSEGSGGGETGGNSLGQALANDPLLREMEGGLSGSSGKSTSASSRSGGGGVREGGENRGVSSSGGSEDAASGGGEGGQGQGSGAEKPSILSRVRGWAASGVEMASSGVGKGVGAVGQGINRAAANAAVKVDRTSDAYSEVGGGNASVFKGNNRALTRHAESLQPGGGGGRGGNPGGDDDDGAGDEGSGDEGGASPGGRWRSRGRTEKRLAKRTGRRVPDER